MRINITRKNKHARITELNRQIAYLRQLTFVPNHDVWVERSLRQALEELKQLERAFR